MGNFHRDDRSGGRRFGGRGFGGDGNMDRQLFKATCSECGKECEVPFRPTGERPVYCRDCFAKRSGNDARGNFGRDNRQSERPVFQSPNNTQLEVINAKLDRILKLLTPTASKALPPQEEKMAEPAAVVSPEEPEVVVKKKRTLKKASEALAEQALPIEVFPRDFRRARRSTGIPGSS